MLIAHLPAGFLLSRQFARDRRDRMGLIATGLVASVLPDLDLIWFYLVNDRQTPHHAFAFHWPLFWCAIAVASWAVARAAKWPRAQPFIWVAFACLILHMLLDSVAADIDWLMPFAMGRVNFTEVPARFDWWVWSFVFHWTFLLELMIVLVAAIVLWSDVTHPPAERPR